MRHFHVHKVWGGKHCLAPFKVCGRVDEGLHEIPRIVVLCGSTKFRDEFAVATRKLTLEGAVVLSVGFFGHGGDGEPTPEQKAKLDDLHLRKIDLADSVFVINVDGYVGESTRNEISYARSIEKPVAYLVDPFAHAAGEVVRELERFGL